MNAMNRCFYTLAITVLLFGKMAAQNTIKSDFFDQIKNYNLSKILIADNFISEDREGNKENLKRAEILGFIGNNYQRLFIHIDSVKQNPAKPYEYIVLGKSKVKETVRSFRGRMTVRQAKIYRCSDIPTYKQGFVTSDVILYEDKTLSATGFFKGSLTSRFIIDNKRRFRYDAVMFISDDYSNNQFVGNWTSYKTGYSKKCNWGDYRIPESGDLDIGAAEFSVNKKYLKNGWLSYMLENKISDFDAIKPTAGQKSALKNWWDE